MRTQAINNTHFQTDRYDMFGFYIVYTANEKANLKCCNLCSSLYGRMWIASREFVNIIGISDFGMVWWWKFREINRIWLISFDVIMLTIAIYHKILKSGFLCWLNSLKPHHAIYYMAHPKYHKKNGKTISQYPVAGTGKLQDFSLVQNEQKLEKSQYVKYYLRIYVKVIPDFILSVWRFTFATCCFFFFSWHIISYIPYAPK